MKRLENTAQEIISIQNEIIKNHINVEKFSSKKENHLNFRQTQKLIQSIFKEQTVSIKHCTYPEHKSFVFNLNTPIDKTDLLSSTLKTIYHEQQQLLKFELEIYPYATSKILIDAQITLKVRPEYQIELI